MIIAVDFDGTVVEHMFPEIGPDVPLALETLIELQEAGHKLILWTVRSGDYLDAAVNYLTACGIELWGINRNPKQQEWSKSPKAYAQTYIDDAALGCPLRLGIEGERNMVDWHTVRNQLVAIGALND